jgi:hypothetical protein
MRSALQNRRYWFFPVAAAVLLGLFALILTLGHRPSVRITNSSPSFQVLSVTVTRGPHHISYFPSRFRYLEFCSERVLAKAFPFITPRTGARASFQTKANQGAICWITFAAPAGFGSVAASCTDASSTDWLSSETNVNYLGTLLMTPKPYLDNGMMILSLPGVIWDRKSNTGLLPIWFLPRITNMAGGNLRLTVVAGNRYSKSRIEFPP